MTMTVPGWRRPARPGGSLPFRPLHPASVGVGPLPLNIPTMALISLVLGRHLAHALDTGHLKLVALGLFIATLTLGTGRTTSLQGGIHLVIFGAFLTISAIP